MPGVGDAVTLAGHTITLDQDVTILSLTSTGAGYLEVSGSDSRLFTVTDTFYPSSTSTAQAFIRFTPSYSAPNSVFDIYNASCLYYGSSMLGMVLFEGGSSGKVTFNFDRLAGDSATNGSEPPLFWYEIRAETSLSINVETTLSPNLAPLIQQSGASATEADIVRPTITLTKNSASDIGVSSTLGVMRFEATFKGHIIMNGNLTRPNRSLLYLNNGYSYSNEAAKVTINPNALFTWYSVLDGFADLIINGDITISTANAVRQLRSFVINGDVECNTGPNLSTKVINLDPLRGIGGVVNGNITMTARSTLFNTEGKPLTVGAEDGGIEYTIESTAGGLLVSGPLILSPGNDFEIIMRSDTDWPLYTGTEVTLTSNGAGPIASDYRASTPNIVGLVGTVAVPAADSVRAGTAVDGTTGVALVDVNDLANLTGGQIATLSE